MGGDIVNAAHLLAAAGFAACAVPGAAAAFDCTGKSGEYCCGNNVCICDAGEYVFMDECLYGCEGASRMCCGLRGRTAVRSGWRGMLPVV